MLNPKPSTITVENHGATTRFTRRWYAPKAWLILVFAAFWNLFLLFWYQKALEASPQDSFILLFPLIHVGIGMGLIYSAATMFLNKSIVELVPGKLTVRHFPLPWRGNLALETRQIQQLYCEEKATTGQRGASFKYLLKAVLKDGNQMTILAAGIGKDEALFLEHSIEGKLGIEPAPVVGECR